ncbi:hypothetical protein HRbin30_03147 [bacterium HR30]|nr:hypothetical protein HRbin30_03147 [bacterium HR30]
MSKLPFWGVGLALAGVALLHWFLTRRMLAVSGRFSALVNRLREGPPEPGGDMTEAELVAAMIAATRAQFGETTEPTGPDTTALATEIKRTNSALLPQSSVTHVVFLGSLVLGGLASQLMGEATSPTSVLRSSRFVALFGDGPLAWVVLALGGVLVGFGTRMAGGCTSGHGLSGVSRLEPGSLVATAAFFGAGIAVSFVLEVLS